MRHVAARIGLVTAAAAAGAALLSLPGRAQEAARASEAPAALSRAAGLSLERARPPRPAGALEVPPGAGLQAAIDAAPAGGALALSPGAHDGPITVSRTVTIWGPPSAVVRSSGEGSTIRVSGDGAALLGFTIDGSGGRFDLLDAAVHAGAAGVRVEGLEITGALFGILVEKSTGALIRGNVVRGVGGESLGLRGDGIRLWETSGSTVVENQVTDSRDVVVWYSSGNRIERNLVARGRYGTHFMYSHRNEVVGNRYLENTVGVFVMYSREVDVRANVIARSKGAAGMGIGLKESGAITVAANRLLDDTVGIYIDTSPMNEGDRVLLEGNLFKMGDAGIAFHASPKRVDARRNVFRDNRVAVRVEGGGDALGAVFSGNDFDDYRGYDMDGDGTGDVPYELRSFSGDLVSRYPDLSFFRGTPVLALADVANHALPLFQPKRVLVDPRPRMGSLADTEPIETEASHGR